jgi:hypothetical protein
MAVEEKATPSPGIEFYGGYQVYSESGIDLTLLKENLRRPMLDRLASNEGFVSLLNDLGGPGLLDLKYNAASVRGVRMFDAEAMFKHLASRKVPYVLIGGLAMITHGSAYVTKDFDLCYSRLSSDIDTLAKAIEPLHPYLRGVPPGLPFQFDPPTIRAGLNFTLTTDLGDLDVLGEVKGVGAYQDALAHSVEKLLYGERVRVLDIDALIASKRAVGRTKDLNHVLELVELKKLLDAQISEGADHA